MTENLLNYKKEHLIGIMLMISSIQYIFSSQDDLGSYPVFFIVVALLIFFSFFKGIKSVYTWGLSVIFYTGTIFLDYYGVANHHFLLLYLSVLMVITIKSNQDDIDKILTTNSIVIISLIMFFAALAKFLSGSFTNGDFIGFLLSNGSLFKGIGSIDYYNDIFLINIKSINSFEFNASISEISKPLSIPFINNQSIVIFSWVIIIMELIFPLLFVSKNQWIRNGYLFFFVTGLAVTRTEAGFISLICILCIGQLNYRWKYYNYFLYYYFIIYLTNITFVVLGIGFS